MDNDELTATYRLALGNAIRSRREAQGLSLRRFASMTGINFTHLAKVEKGESGVTIDLLVKIAGGLGITVSELIPF